MAQIDWNGHSTASIRPDVLDMLNRVAGLVDFPLVINSGYRDPESNKRAGGAKASQHMHGEAIDISLNGLSNAQRTQLTQALVQAGAHRIGAYSGNTALHVDMAKAWDKAKGDYPVYPMFDRSIHNMGKAHDWFTAGLSGPPVPPQSIPNPPVPATRTAQQAINAVAPVPAGRPLGLGYAPQVPTPPAGFSSGQRQAMGNVVSGSFDAIQPKAPSNLYDGIYPLSQPLRSPPPIPVMESYDLAKQRARMGDAIVSPSPVITPIDSSQYPVVVGKDVTPPNGVPPGYQPRVAMDMSMPQPPDFIGDARARMAAAGQPPTPAGFPPGSQFNGPTAPIPQPPIARQPVGIPITVTGGRIEAPPMPMPPLNRSALSPAPIPAGAILRGSATGTPYDVGKTYGFGDKLMLATPGGFVKVYDPTVIGSGHNLFGSLINGGIAKANNGGMTGLFGLLMGNGSGRSVVSSGSGGSASSGRSGGFDLNNLWGDPAISSGF